MRKNILKKITSLALFVFAISIQSKHTTLKIENRGIYSLKHVRFDNNKLKKAKKTKKVHIQITQNPNLSSLVGLSRLLAPVERTVTKLDLSNNDIAISTDYQQRIFAQEMGKYPKLKKIKLYGNSRITHKDVRSLENKLSRRTFKRDSSGRLCSTDPKRVPELSFYTDERDFR